MKFLKLLRTYLEPTEVKPPILDFDNKYGAVDLQFESISDLLDWMGDNNLKYRKLLINHPKKSVYLVMNEHVSYYCYVNKTSRAS